jgi:integrase
LRPFFGAMPIAEITTGTIEDWIEGLIRNGLEPKTVHNQWKQFRSMINWHFRRKDQREPIWNPTLPDIPDSKARWYTETEMNQIIEISAEYPGRFDVKQYKPLFRLDAYSGLRSGEISGLHVEDIDFELGIINVKRSIFKGVEVPTKGKRIRDVFIDSITVRMLQKYLGVRTTGRIFAGRNGNPISNFQLVTVLHWCTEQLGIKRGGMHAFRHGRVSHMISNGVHTKIVQVQVGHQHERTTDIYTHNELKFLRDTAERLAVPNFA